MMINPADPPQTQVEKQAKIIDALIQRANRQRDVGPSAFQAFQNALELKRQVVAQSRDLEQAAHELESAHFEREHIRRALSEALSSMEEGFALFSDGLLDLFNDQFANVLTDVAEVMRAGLPLEVFLDHLWSSTHFVSSDRDLASVKAYGGQPLDVASTLSAVIELRDDLWFQLNIQKTTSANLVLLLTEITQLVRRNRAEKATLIDRQADYLQAVFQNISAGVCTFSADDTVMMYNNLFRETLGVPEHVLATGSRMEGVIGYLFRCGRIQTEQVEEVYAWRRQLRAKGRAQNRVRVRSDLVFDVQANTLPDGGFVVELKDVTLEARNKELLENRVMERTAELTRANEKLVREYDEKARVEEELRLAKERAEAAVSSKTRFLAAASHDLLQPINAAKLLISTLRQTTSDTPHAAMVERLEGAFGSAEQLLHSLLDLSRLESPDPDAVSPTEVSLSPILEGVHADQTLVARKKGVTLDMVPSSAFVRSDPIYLLRSVQNLVVNAIQYTEPGGRVLFGCRRRGDQAILEVWDTGVGIARKDQQRIFEEFARVGDDTTPDSGLGLGLSVVDRACRLLGHGLSVRSAPRRGSVFSIAMECVAGTHRPKEISDDLMPTGSTASDYIVLVIENDLAVLDSMTLWLEQWGVAVLPAQSIELALEMARDIGMPPDVILADYQLDGPKTGVDAIRMVREMYDVNVPALLITANRQKSLWREGAENDVSVLAKPVKLAPLRGLIDQKVRRFRRAQSDEQEAMPTKVQGDVAKSAGHALQNGRN
ncbi:MAG: PAS-domain containing protein [Pseudomonadota bacterium]